MASWVPFLICLLAILLLIKDILWEERNKTQIHPAQELTTLVGVKVFLIIIATGVFFINLWTHFYIHFTLCFIITEKILWLHVILLNLEMRKLYYLNCRSHFNLQIKLISQTTTNKITDNRYQAHTNKI